MKILVVGIGQSMRRDDAAGLEAARLWQARYPQSAARVRLETTELPDTNLIDMLAGVDAAVLVDAFRSTGVMEDVTILSPDELADSTSEAGSTHGWGIAETLRLGRILVPSLASCSVTLVGIKGIDFGFGENLSPEVRVRVQKAAEVIEREIQEYFE